MVINSEQQEAITYGDGPLLIIAGAGTGKTTVVTERIKHLITTYSVQPEKILALTFTEKASREMVERLDLVLPYGVTQMWISTFHSFCDRLLRTEGLSIGLNPNYVLMTEASSLQFLQHHMFSFQLSYFQPLGNPNKFSSGLLQHFSRLKDEDVSPVEYADWVEKQIKDGTIADDEREKYEELVRAYRLYEDAKAKYGMLDYADLISYSLKLFRDRPHILQECQDKFSYVLIDEFQDTNYAQNELAKLISEKHKNITVVGDDDQAIYRWRGAALSNMMQFRATYPQAKVVVLTKNYRSTVTILDRSYALIQHNNPDRLEVAEHIQKKLTCERGIQGGDIAFIYTERVEDEAEQVVKEILALKNTRKSDGMDVFWKDIAILVRANTHAEAFVRSLGRAGVPYQFLGPGQLFRQPEVKDLICYLNVLFDVTDNVSLYRIFSMDHFQIQSRDVALLVSFARSKGLSFYETGELVKKKADATDGSEELKDLRITDDGQKKISSLIALIQKHLALIHKESAGQILYYFMQESGYLQSLSSYQTKKDEVRVENIAKFFDKLKTYETDHDDASVFEVVEWIKLSMEIGESPVASNIDWSLMDAVNILTVHSSKGLEFPFVFMVNLASGRFPTTEKHDQIPIPQSLMKEILPQEDYHEEDERRLFYVGMTRARDLLYFSVSKYYGEGKREKAISPFVYEVLGKGIEGKLRKKSPPEGGSRQLPLIGWEKKIPAEGKEIVGSSVTYLSYSQIDTFKTCPLQYKYRYIVRIPVQPSAALSFGDIIHKTLQQFYEQKGKNGAATKESLLSIYEKQWKSRGFKDKSYEKKMKTHGIELLEGFYAKGYDPHKQTIGLEQTFKIFVTPRLIVGGKIDRIDAVEGGIEIIDYKTGSAPKKRNISTDMQLSLYALAAYEQDHLKNAPEFVTVSFYFLEGQEVLSTKRTLDELMEVKNTVKTTADEIAVSRFDPTPGRHCDFCEFRLICDAWK